MAVDRADDIGTQFPVDADDSNPLDPQLGRQEYDYSTGPEPRALAVGTAAAAADSPITQYKLVAVANDTYVVRTIADGVEGALITIAKPWQLRRSVFADGVNGIGFEFETATFRKVTDTDGSIYFEEITPPYYLDAEIMYVSLVNATEVEGTTQIELNTNAHHWTKVAGVFRARIVAIFADYLECLNVDEAGDDVGTAPDDIFLVAKPRKLQQTPWDGETVTGGGQSILYEYLGIDFREATLVGGDFDGDKQEEIVVPRYTSVVGGKKDIIHYAQVVNGTGVTAGLDKVVFVDLNVDSRGWVRSRVTT